MPAKNEPSDPRPLSAAPDETRKKKTGKPTATGSAKASARTRAASTSAASEAPETATPKPRRKTASAANAEPSVVKATPRVRRSTRTAGAAATASAASAPTVGVVEALDAPTVSDAQHAPAVVEAEVRVRAYMLSLARGDGPGSPDTDWYQAEREVALTRQR